MRKIEDDEKKMPTQTVNEGTRINPIGTSNKLSHSQCLQLNSPSAWLRRRCDTVTSVVSFFNFSNSRLTQIGDSGGQDSGGQLYSVRHNSKHPF